MVTLIPAGAASPHGLGVMIGLHGAGGTAASMAANIAPSMTRARVTRFAIVCVDGGETYWHEHAGGDDPAGMIVHEVLPRAAAAGMRTARVGVGGESMGGFGALLIAERLASTSTSTGASTSTGTGTSRGTSSPAAAFVAALSPAVFATYGDARAANAAAFDSPANFARNDVFSGLPALRHVPAYVVCGTDDPFAPETTRVRARLAALTRRPVPGGIMPGCHDSAFWGRHWPTALELMGPYLGGPAPGQSSAACAGVSSPPSGASMTGTGLRPIRSAIRVSSSSWAARWPCTCATSCRVALASWNVASARLSAAAACTFWPTMMTDSSTSCRKVCATHWTIVGGPPLIASGRLIRSNNAKAYAHHMLPTMVVTSSATFVLNRLTAEPRGSRSATFTGLSASREAIRGCRMCWYIAMTRPSVDWRDAFPGRGGNSARVISRPGRVARAKAKCPAGGQPPVKMRWAGTARPCGRRAAARPEGAAQ